MCVFFRTYKPTVLICRVFDFESEAQSSNLVESYSFDLVLE